MSALPTFSEHGYPIRRRRRADRPVKLQRRPLCGWDRTWTCTTPRMHGKTALLGLSPGEQGANFHVTSAREHHGRTR
jgi:hypothetical protein